MKLKFLAFVVLCHFSRFSNGDVEVRVDELETQVKELRDEVNDLSKAIEDLEKSVVKRNIADQKLDKAIASVLLNKQKKASMYWGEVVNYVDPTLLSQYLKNLVENTYLGDANNFYFVLDFLVRNELYMGFPMLYKELEQHRELQTGQEVFALASTIKSRCGKSNELYVAMPKVVQEVLAGPVILKNIDNMGYITADEDNFPCDDRSMCYQNNKAQIFLERFPPTTTQDVLKAMARAQWQFIGPENITELSLGFYMKNVDKDLFFIFAQRPPSGFLKGNTTFLPYYAKDMQAQFLPALVPNTTLDESLIKIGVREKFFKKISYFFGGEFSKKATRISMSRLPIFQGNVKGYVFEVIPVSSDNIDNAIEAAEMNEKCKLTM